MVFTHDTDMTLMHAAALANTGPALGDEDREELPDLPALLGWMDRWEWTGRRPTSQAEVDRLDSHLFLPVPPVLLGYPAGASPVVPDVPHQFPAAC